MKSFSHSLGVQLLYCDNVSPWVMERTGVGKKREKKWLKAYCL